MAAPPSRWAAAAISTAIGGVPVCLNFGVDDSFSEARGSPAGPQTLSGPAALAFVRQRHDLPQGDLDRVRRQQVFLSAMAHAALAPATVTDPAKVAALFDAVDHAATVDQGFSVLGAASQLQAVESGSIAFRTIPIVTPTFPSPGRRRHGGGGPAGGAALHQRRRRDRHHEQHLERGTHLRRGTIELVELVGVGRLGGGPVAERDVHRLRALRQLRDPVDGRRLSSGRATSRYGLKGRGVLRTDLHRAPRDLAEPEPEPDLGGELGEDVGGHRRARARGTQGRGLAGRARRPSRNSECSGTWQGEPLLVEGVAGDLPRLNGGALFPTPP